MGHISMFLVETVFFVSFTCGMEMSAIYQEAGKFDGFSVDVGDISRIQCAIRYQWLVRSSFSDSCLNCFSNRFKVYKFKEIKIYKTPVRCKLRPI